MNVFFNFKNAKFKTLESKLFSTLNLGHYSSDCKLVHRSLQID